MLSLFGLFGPALTAIRHGGVVGDRSGYQGLAWMSGALAVGAHLYVIALGGRAVLGLTAAGLAAVLRMSSSVQVGTLSVFNFVIFAVVVGEELGWRRFSLFLPSDVPWSLATGGFPDPLERLYLGALDAFA